MLESIVIVDVTIGVVLETHRVLQAHSAALNDNSMYCRGIHEDLLHFLCTAGSSCRLPERDRQLPRLRNSRQRVWPNLPPSLMEGGEEIRKSAGLPDDAAGAPLESDPPTL